MAAAPQSLDALLAARTVWPAGRGTRCADAGQPTGHAALDAALPGGGWPPRALTELLLPADGVGEISLLFPALSMFFFVVPQEQVARNPVVATMAVAGLSLFAVMSASLFTYGLGVAEDRQLPFDPFVRSLPAGPRPRMGARIGNGAIFSLFGLVPLVLIGWLFTDASVTAVQLVAGVGTILVASVPFVLLGMAVGYSLSAKAALPVLLGWTALFAALAVAAYRRDEGRRFR